MDKRVGFKDLLNSNLPKYMPRYVRQIIGIESLYFIYIQITISNKLSYQVTKSTSQVLKLLLRTVQRTYPKLKFRNSTFLLCHNFKPGMLLHTDTPLQKAIADKSILTSRAHISFR